MTKFLCQTFVLSVTVLLVCASFSQVEAKADESVNTNFFFEAGECEYLEGRSKRLCLLHCELLECDESESLDLGPVLSFYHERTCTRILDKYEEESGAPGPPCFCEQACDIQFDECVAGCEDYADPVCCRIQCGNSRSVCDNHCCIQQGELVYLECIETTCGGVNDENCFCLQSFCAVGVVRCPVLDP